jgi:N-acetylmuramoyl-L-alanine amidase
MIFPPDSTLANAVEASPHHGPRLGHERPSLLILHYTGMKDAATAKAWLSDPRSQVSCHYLVDEDGTILQMVPEDRRAWHAGRSTWRDIADVNSASIGIEIVNPGHEFGYRPFPEAQMAAVTALARDIVERHAIGRRDVLAHSDVAPLRKQDPGEMFDWRRLAAAGVGLHVEPAPLGGGRFLSRGDEGRPVEALQAMLALHGYGVAIDGRYDELTEAVVRAFQRHFRQSQIDGVADQSTITTLRDLVAWHDATA